MTNTNYNGWTNLETWQAALWLGEHNYHGILLDKWKDDGEIPIVEPEDINDFVVEIMLPEAEGIVADILNGWLARINWREIAESYNLGLENEE